MTGIHYAFGPNYSVWIIHVIIGIYLLSLSSMLINDPENKDVEKSLSYSVLCLAVLMVSYHGHLIVKNYLRWK